MCLVYHTHTDRQRSHGPSPSYFPLCSPVAPLPPPLLSSASSSSNGNPPTPLPLQTKVVAGEKGGGKRGESAEPKRASGREGEREREKKKRGKKGPLSSSFSGNSIHTEAFLPFFRHSHQKKKSQQQHKHFLSLSLSFNQ